MIQGYVDVTCPHCWQIFSIPGPAPEETPCSWDYDCEVCCRPMWIHFEEADGSIIASAEGLED